MYVCVYVCTDVWVYIYICMYLLLLEQQSLGVRGHCHYFMHIHFVCFGVVSTSKLCKQLRTVIYTLARYKVLG